MDEESEEHASAEGRPSAGPPRRRPTLRGAHAYRLPVGSVLKRGLGIWIGNLLPFSIFALALGAPVFAGLYVVAVRLEFESPADMASAWTSMVTGALLSAGVAHVVFRQLQGERTSIGEAVSVGFRNLIPVIGVGLLVGILTILGTLACYVPGIIAQCAFFIAVPACVVERPGVIASMKRSLKLTDRNRLPIFGLFVSFNVMNLGAMLLLGVALGILEPSVRATTVAFGAVAILGSSLFAVLQAVAYHDLRLGKEGVDVSRLASVFE